MAKKVKQKEPAPAIGENFFVFSPEKKTKILGIFLIVFALLIFLSILSYSRFDESYFSYKFSDQFGVFGDNAELKEKAATTHNWLGIFGSYISHFFIRSTIGYFSLVFPVIMFIWGYTILKKEKAYKVPLYLSNFLIIISLLITTFFGMLQSTPEIALFTDVYELSGKIGLFLGTVIGRLLGGLGSIIVLSTAILITLIVAFDFKFGSILEFLKRLLKDDEESEEKEETIAPKADENLDKIKNLREEGKLKKLFKGKTDDELAAAAVPVEPETKITIVKKDQPEKVVDAELDKPVEATKKKIELKKAQPKDDGSEPTIDKTTEATLPNQWEEVIDYTPPKLDLLSQPEGEEVVVAESELKRNAELLKEKLALFDIQIEDITVTPGPVVTLYEIVPAPGVKISRIVSLEHDIALALAARGIRIIAPIPGKSAIGVEIPNAKAIMVRASSVLSKIKDSKAELPLAFGKTISGDVYITDLAKMPHMLIAGATGSGKSVGINMVLCSLIYAKHPSDVKFVIVDPKKIELSFYKKLNKHFLAISPDLEEEIITNPQYALLVLKAVEYEMEKRYDKLAKAGVRNIVDYNAKMANPKTRLKDTEEMQHHKMPYIVVVIDELADLMITSGKEVEEPIARLAQLARAVGIHLILATQRPSVNVITGVIKANFNARAAYQVASKIDSRTILDMNGAEQLLGAGDMLFLPAGMPKPIRIQNAFISTEEVEKITNFIYVQKGYSKRYFLPSLYEKKKEAMGNFLADLDPMFEEAARTVVRHQQGSVSLLQRRLKLGYSRAARIVDQLEQAGIVGPSEGSKAREVIVESEEQLETILRSI
ncbi:MAG: cell division protein FtsK [Stygiobacter sp. RIFOXYC2_FULL_38_25]|nr:MAG: cell division protein FtsK [Stygiobacter sp. GWC2_38_9]OGV08178.1 MAG: cell division protein FtsK [Stygiobacter sp. RIFOXYB2_FULL_37_11]OGV15694.1 MAG: cell division protein FtsK [Stygiobacter sp. RIFOXYC2_FULL_38_25]OGV80808.1 MAG: cell division protein FtsK [Stygiobacter sp. GWF2_38_21]